MPLHLIKLCVGADLVEDLARFQAERLRKEKTVYHLTRMSPKRKDALLAGGSLYWVMGGIIRVRQRLTDIVSLRGSDGIMRCRLILDPVLVETRAFPRRAFQGWRYLEAADAPPDLPERGGDDLPAHLRRELETLGLL